MNGSLGAGIIFAILAGAARSDVARFTCLVVALFLAIVGYFIWLADRIEKDKASRR